MTALYRRLATERAEHFLGVTEHPPSSNSGPQVTAWLRRAGINVPAPWCMAFAWCMFDDVGMTLEYPNKASVGFFQDWASRHGFIVATPKPYDVVCYRFDSDNWPDHVGFVTDVGGRRIKTIEGNTSFGSDANGGKVMRRDRAIVDCSFVRIPGTAPVKPPPTPARQVWKDLPGPRPKPPWFWDAIKELDRRRSQLP